MDSSSPPMDLASPLPRQLNFATFQQFSSSIQENNPRFGYHCLVLNNLTLLRCSCNPKTLDLCFTMNTCNFDFSKVHNLSSMAWGTLNIMARKIHTFQFVSWFLEVWEPSTNNVNASNGNHKSPLGKTLWECM